MVFWGVEVKAGEKLKCEPEFEKLICITNAVIGRSKKHKAIRNMVGKRKATAENIPLRLRVDGKNFIIGFISNDQPRVKLSLVIEKDFRLFHDFTNASVYFIGFIRNDPVADHVFYYDFYGVLEDKGKGKDVLTEEDMIEILEDKGIGKNVLIEEEDSLEVKQ